MNKWQKLTRGGYAYRIYASEDTSYGHIHGAFLDKDKLQWTCLHWLPSGRIYEESVSDLDLLPAKVRRWKTAEELVQEWKDGMLGELQFNGDGCVTVWKKSYGRWIRKPAIPDSIDSYNAPGFQEIFTTEEP
jgi:hypothetical protein